MFGIYSIVNTSNNHIYIGSTSTSFDQRFGEHKRKLGRKTHANKHLQNAWNKYGKDSFKFCIIEVLDDVSKVITAEQFYLDVFFGDTCYNLNPVAGTMASLSNNMKGRKWTEKKRNASKNMNARVYNGFISPDGTQYNNIINLSAFMIEHKLNRKRVYDLINRKIFEYKGWKYVSI